MANDAFAIEIAPPDISRWREGNTGIEYVSTFDGARPGPHVMISALMHGNETCGAIAVDRLLRDGVRPNRGKLTLAFLNTAAFARFDAATRKDTRFVDEDLNRVWDDEIIDGEKLTAEIGRARALRPLIRTVDYLLDIHSMGLHSAPLMLVHGLEKERALARRMGYPANVVCGPGHIRGRRLIEYAPFNDPTNAKTAALIECGQHWSRSSAKVALDCALHFLAAIGTVDNDFIASRLTDPKPATQRLLDVTGGVTAESAAFRFVQPFIGLEEFAKQGSLIAIDGDKQVVTPHDDCILVMPHSAPRKGERVLRFARLAR